MSFFNHQTLVLSPGCESFRDFMLSIPDRFEKGEGTIIHKGRNELRKITYNGNVLVVKSFRTPNIINRFVLQKPNVLLNMPRCYWILVWVLLVPSAI